VNNRKVATVADLTRTATGRCIARLLIVCFVAQTFQLGDTVRAAGVVTRAGSSSAAAMAVFGPKDYVRSTGQPVTVSDTFSIANPGTALLHITNGGASGQYERVSSAVITLNGVTVVSPDELVNPEETVMPEESGGFTRMDILDEIQRSDNIEDIQSDQLQIQEIINQPIQELPGFPVMPE
jgi:hypothetical protein